MLGRRLRALIPAVVLVAGGLATGATAATSGSTSGAWRYSEYRISSSALDTLRTDFVNQILSTHRTGTWAPMKMTLNDRDLRLMGLPSKNFLLKHRFSKPTLVTPDGRTQDASGLPTAATFAGTGYFGIRPGAWLLTVTDQEIGWCSMAHVYGAPGSYKISTAGHCGKAGDT